MKVDIEKLIEELEKKIDPTLFVGFSLDEIFKGFLEKDEKELVVILENTALESRLQSSIFYPKEYRKKIESYYVTGIFELGKRIFPKYRDSLYDSGFEYVLYIFSKDKPKKLKICTAPRENTEYGKEIKTDLNGYYKDLEYFINSSKVRPNIKSLVNIIPYNSYHKGQYNVHFYTKKYLSMRKKQKTKPLKDLVEIFIYDNDDVEFEWECADSEITIDSEIVIKTSKKDTVCKTPLKNGDVVLEYRTNDEFKPYFILNENKYEIPLGMIGLILRVKSNLITPEYVYLYVQSSFFKTLSTAIWLGQYKNLEDVVDEVAGLPVYLPNTDTPLALNKELSQKYRDILDRTYRPYLFKKDGDYFSNALRPNKSVVKEDALLDELLDSCFKEPHKRNLLNYISENMKELNVSIPNGAYRSAVVLIGSILEAFLTDWASELDGVNYFKVPYREVLVDGRKLSRDMTLNDAICRIAKLIKKWSAKEMAEAIRVMRNGIHPRVFLDNGKNLTKRECEKAVKNLEAVIRSRYNDYSSSSPSLV